MTKKKQNFLTETDTPRWWLILGAVLTFAFTNGFSYWMQAKDRQLNNQAEQIGVLINSMAEFQVYAAAFATEIMASGSVKSETRERLVGNVNEQFSKIAIVVTLPIDETEKRALEQYKAKLLKAVQVINDTSDVSSMRAFWEAVSDVTMARKDLNKQLQELI